MRKIVIAGTYREYRDWLTLVGASQRAAVYVHDPSQFCRFDPEQDEIELVGTYSENPAYQSREYWAFRGYEIPQPIAV